MTQDHHSQRIQINRERRNVLLAGTDWTQLPDVPLLTASKTAFATYRQALRDIDLFRPQWPTQPAEEWEA
jgi:hypothetical protein